MNEISYPGAGPQINPQTGEVMEVETASLAQQLTKAEIDQQIATAHAYKRSPAVAAQGIAFYATYSPEAAAECNYALPRGGKSLTGPSIRLAEIVAAEYGNCRVGARVVHVDRFEKYIEAEGVFHDLEKNTATTARVRRRIVDSRGRLFNDDMIIVTGNAACSIAKRNAILAGVPKALWMPAYEGALKVIKGDAKTLTERREGALRALGAFGVTPDMICAALEIEGPIEITLEHMPTLIAWHNALKDETATVESLFGPATKEEPKAKGSAPKGAAEKMANLAGGGSAAERPADGQKADQAPTPQDQAEAPTGAQDAGAGGQDQGDAPDQAPAEPSEADLAAAKARGEEAYGLGMPLGAVPSDLADNDALTKAWKAGWTAGEKAAKA